MFVELAERSTSPVDALMNTNPAGEAVNVPPLTPVMVGIGSVAEAQKEGAE